MKARSAAPPFSQALANELLAIYGSPLYVYESDRLHQTLQHITQAVPYPHTRFHFASVTNGNVALLQQIQQAGWGLHANTPGDVYLGLQAGFLPGQIVYSGSNLSDDDMRQLLAWNIHQFNLDSLSQLQQLCQIYLQNDWQISSQNYMCNALQKHNPHSLTLGLRLNSPSLTGDSRIGIRPDEFAEAEAIAQQHDLQISGLHFYRGTGTNATAAFTQVIDQVIAIAQSLTHWRSLDFGGGFGYAYRAGGVAFNWPEWGEAISQKLAALSRPIDLVIEPGRAAIAGCGSVLAKVVSVKWQGERQLVGVDTTVANLSVPAVHGGYREITTWNPDDRPLYETDVCGNTTYSRDYLGHNCWLPEMQVDEAIAILDTGAYGYAMSSHFLHRPRPAEVLVEGDRHRLIRHREDYRILLSGQIFNPIET